MELFRNEFKCVECDGVGYANSVEAILKRGKLCRKCFLKSKGLEDVISLSNSMNEFSSEIASILLYAGSVI